jgi:hypothetical protein
MFKKIILLVALLGLFLNNAAKAAVSFQLDPYDGTISGLPGTAMGWGFTLTNTENFLVVTSSAFEPSAPLGTFTDFISAPDNFFVVGPAPAASNSWSQVFNATTKTGLGSFTFSPTTLPDTVAYGEIVISYDLFSRSPLDPNFNPDTDTLSNGNELTAFASVSTVPSPGAFCLFGSAMLGTLGLLKKSGLHFF